MAKPMPIEPPLREKIAVLMPTSCPFMSTSAPPELPGLMAASVWMKKPESAIADMRAGERRDDAAGHRLADAERVADGEHEVADLERVGIADRDHRKRLGVAVDLQHREVERSSSSRTLLSNSRPSDERDLDLVGAAR